MEEDIKFIISGENNSHALKNFLKKAEQTFSFPELDHSNLRQQLWNAIYNKIQNTTDEEELMDCFAVVRTLSREKTGLNEIISEEWLKLLQKHSGLDENYKKPVKSDRVALEVVKALCNIVFNSPVALTLITKNGTLDNIVYRIHNHLTLNQSEELNYFDLKLLFAITTFCSEIRYKVREELHGVSYLLELLNAIYDKELKKSANLRDKQVDIICEILKILFNLTVTRGVVEFDDTEQQQFIEIATLSRKLLIIPTETNEKRSQLISHTVNLLTNLPIRSFDPLIVPVEKGKKIPNNLQYEGHDMTAIHTILQALKKIFSNKSTLEKQYEILTPYLTALIKCAAANRLTRKYLKLQVLPPLKDVRTRPEEGTTLRNYLCQLLTSPMQAKDLAAEFLFILCRHNVDRMIKYTGYGNAAGLLARRGLLGGRQPEEAAYYISDSEDSETEEYKEYKHAINLVTGCYEEPKKSDSSALMTDEQKEYEAMKMVQLIDKMTKTGVITPCKIGEDGHPEPITHVLQLQEGLPKQQVKNIYGNSSDSD